MPDQSDQSIDQLDARLLHVLRSQPRLGMLETARRLGVARGTATSRLEKLQRRGVVTGFGPDIDLRALGFPVMAFTVLEMTQGRIDQVVTPLHDIPYVLEVHSIAGRGDLLARIVARSNDHLMTIIEQILQSPDIARAETMIALAEQIPFRVDPLIATAPGVMDEPDG